jgi:cation transport ATPase
MKTTVTTVHRVKPWRRTEAARAAQARRRPPWTIGLLTGALVVAGAVLGWVQPAGMTRVMDIACALVSPLLVLQPAVETWCHARARHWGMAALMVAGTLVALGWCVVAWQRVL